MIQLEFAFQEIKLKVKTIILRENLQNGQKTYGVKFLYDTPFAVNKFLIKKLIKKLKRQEKIKSNIKTMV